RQPGRDGRRDAGTVRGRVDRGHGRRGQDRHGRGAGHARALYLPAAGGRGARVRDHDAGGRRHWAQHRHQCDHVHAGRVPHPHDARGHGHAARQHWLHGQGQLLGQGAAARAGPRGGARAQDPRGLGRDARGHRRVPRGVRRDGRADHHPHRHAQRVGLCRAHAGRHRRPHHPRLPHRGRGRRPRAGHLGRVRPPVGDPLVDQPDAPVHVQHLRRAPGHADGVPPPGQAHRRGRGLCREPHPRRDHRRRGRDARRRRHLRHVVRLAGHGPHWRGRRPHLAHRRQDEAPARPPPRARRQRAPGRAARLRQRPRRQLPHPPLHCKVHHQPGHRPRPGPRRRVHRGGQDRRSGAVGPAGLWHPALGRHQGRDARICADRRRQRLHPDRPAR
ncbi:hypothetical protein IWQ56_006745, partial [Coemansia nantahalensis]